jgi:hypothetical protein
MYDIWKKYTWNQYRIKIVSSLTCWNHRSEIPKALIYKEFQHLQALLVRWPLKLAEWAFLPQNLQGGAPPVFVGLEPSQTSVIDICMYVYIYMVPPPVPTLFVLLLVFTVFFAYFGVYMFLTFFQINLDIVSRGSTIYIYNRGCRQTCETWWFWHQEVLGGPRTSLEPRTKNQDCTESLGGILVLGS